MSGDLYVTMTYNDLRRLAAFCGPISQLGWDLTSSGVMLSTTPEGLKAQTGGNDVFAYGTMDAEIHSHGQCLVLGTAFADVIKALPLEPDDLIDLAAVEDELDIRSVDGRYHRTLFLIPDGAFMAPLIPDMGKAISVPPDTAEWLKRTASAASTDNQRAPLNSIHISTKGMVATDSYRFIIVEFPWDDLETTVNVPVDLVRRIPDPSTYGDGEIRLATNDNMVALMFGQLTLCGAVIPGEYPDPEMIKGIIPQEDTYSFNIGVKDLQRALKAVQPFVGPLGGATLHPDEKIRVTSQDLGMAEDELSFMDEYNVPVPVCLPVAFLRECTSLLKDEESLQFIFHPEKPDKYPVILRAADGRVLIGAMPLAIQN